MYFTDLEMSCPCCGNVDMDKGFMDRLNAARGIAGIPFVINSAYRCEKHNEFVGGKNFSSHLYGYAADISCLSSLSRYKILKALCAVRFNRIGIYKTFIHVDSDPNKVGEVMWVR